MSDEHLARRILTQLGFAQEPSMDPGIDPRRDRIADMIAGEQAALRASHDRLLKALENLLHMAEVDPTHILMVQAMNEASAAIAAACAIKTT